MTKDVIVTISGLQFAQETETEPVEIVTAGSYYKKNGKHYIIYDESWRDLREARKISSS